MDATFPSLTLEDAVPARAPREPDVRAGAVAGALGGIAGGLAKIACEAIAPPRPPEREAPPAVLLERLSGRDLSDGQKQAGSLAIHFAISALSSAVYGALAEVAPAVRAGGGTAFGLAVWAGAHEVALPLLRLTPALPDLPVSEQLNEAVTHAIFGGVTEAVRGALRGRLGGASTGGLQ